jgi:hypothetical protein
MMKKILLVLCILVLSSCSNSTRTIDEGKKNYTVKVIEGCEYIEFDYGYSDMRVYSLTHKGNCKLCLERNLNNEK